MCLYDVNDQNMYAIQEVPHNDLLESLGLRVGVNVSVLTKQPFGGPIVIKLKRRSIAIDKNVAQQIVARRI